MGQSKCIQEPNAQHSKLHSDVDVQPDRTPSSTNPSLQEKMTVATNTASSCRKRGGQIIDESTRLANLIDILAVELAMWNDRVLMS